MTEDLGISRAPLLYGLSGLSVITASILVVMIWQMATGRLAVKAPDTAAEVDPADRPAH